MGLTRARQSLWFSFLESNTNAGLGLVISFVFTRYGLQYISDCQPTSVQAAGITACYFLLSMIRSFILRRVFNGLG
jgi:hypothetical protein